MRPLVLVPLLVLAGAAFAQAPYRVEAEIDSPVPFFVPSVWEMYPEDLDVAARMGCNAFRMGLEWRSEPVGERGIKQGKGALVWVEPVKVDGKAVGEIVLTESLAPMYHYLHSTLVHLGLLTLLLICIVGVWAYRRATRHAEAYATVVEEWRKSEREVSE